MASVSAAEAVQQFASNGDSNLKVIKVDRPNSVVVSGGLAIEYSLSAKSVFAREMLMISYRLDTNDAFISLRIKIEPKAGEEYITLKTRKHTLPTAAGKRYRYELNVLYNTIQSGELDFRVPDLIYSEGGRDAYLFRFASQSLQVKTLPVYLPPYMPMGGVEIASFISERSSWFNPLETGRVYYWNISLTGEKIGAQAMPEILQQITSNRYIQFLPAEVSRKADMYHDTVIQRINYSIPFTLKKSGYITLPAIRLQYYVPLAGRLASRTYAVAGLFSLNVYLQWFIVISLVVLFLLLAWKIRHFVKRLYLNLLTLHRARRQLRNAGTPQQIRLAMKCLGQSWGWPENLSMEQWMQNWQQTLAVDEKLDECIKSLSRSLYSAVGDQDGTHNIPAVLRSAYLRQLRLCVRASLSKYNHGVTALN